MATVITEDQLMRSMEYVKKYHDSNSSGSGGGGSLTGTVGSETQPIYLDDGELKETSTSLSDYLPISGGTLTGGYFGTAVNVENVDIDVSKGSVFEIDLSSDISLSFSGVPEGVASCFSVIVNIDENVTSNIDITWPDSVEWSSGITPIFNAGTTTVVNFLSSNGGIKWFGSISVGYGLGYGYLSLSGGIVTGDVVVGGTFTAGTIAHTSGVNINGATITSDGHLLLSTGIEIY